MPELESCPNAGKLPFASWPTDLLIDYILKIHHRNIREQGPELLALVEKVAQPPRQLCCHESDFSTVQALDKAV